MTAPPLHVAPLSAADVRSIQDWPPYRGAFAPLDYALRAGGWLDAFPPSDRCRQLGLWSGGELVGFALLVDITKTQAELYIAIHPDRTGRGHGSAGTALVRDLAFNELGLSRVYLKVRTWHHGARRIYERLGFRVIGQKVEPIQGVPERFDVMEVVRAP